MSGVMSNPLDLLNPKNYDEKKTSIARYEICKACPYYVSLRCKKCGCFMAAKTKLKEATCPIGKW